MNIYKSYKKLLTAVIKEGEDFKNQDLSKRSISDIALSINLNKGLPIYDLPWFNKPDKYLDEALFILSVYKNKTTCIGKNNVHESLRDIIKTGKINKEEYLGSLDIMLDFHPFNLKYLLKDNIFYLICESDKVNITRYLPEILGIVSILTVLISRILGIVDCKMYINIKEAHILIEDLYEATHYKDHKNHITLGFVNKQDNIFNYTKENVYILGL